MLQVAQSVKHAVALGLLVTIVATASACASSTGGGEADRWSSLPRTIECVVEESGTMQDPPPSLQVQHVSLRHPGGQRLEISLEYPEAAPADPTAVSSSYGGIRSATGSVSTSILVVPVGAQDDDPYLAVSSPEPAVGSGWNAEIVASGANADANALRSSTVNGRTRTLVVDFGDRAEVLGSGKFSADISVVTNISGSTPTTATLLKAQRCDWNDTVSASTTGAVPTASSPTPSSASAAQCRGTTEILCTAERQYVDDLRKYDLRPSRTVREFVNLGWRICEMLHKTSYDAATEELFREGNLNRQQIQLLVGGAQAHLCGPTPTTESSITTPPPGTVTAFTRIDWAGTRCIEMSSARSNDPIHSGSGTVCSDNGSWEFTEHPRPGNLVGADPVMGGANWISCKLYLNGKLDFSDRADAGDGTDVNCLRTLR